MSKFIEPSIEEIKLEKLYQDMGLSDKEYDKVVEILGREPNFTEVGIFSVMWLSLIHISEPTRPY